MLKNRKPNVWLLFVLAISLFSSCKQTPENVGGSIQPEGSYIKASFTGGEHINACSQRIDSLATSSASYMLLGNLNDPVFGTSDLGFYTQLSTTTSSYSWGVNPVVDSIVLQLYYANYYGDTTVQQTVSVWEIMEDMKPDSTYFSGDELSVDENPLAEYAFYPHPKTILQTGEDTIIRAAVLRIPINIELGQRFIEADQSNFATNEAFHNFFKGIHVKTNNINDIGAICYFNIVNSNSFLRLYYHDDYDTTFYDFDVTSADARFNHFYHDYNNASSPINFNDTVNKQYLYVQGTAGVKSWFKFPDLAAWAKSQDGYVLINEAKLILTGASENIYGAVNDTSIFKPATDYVVVKAKADGTYSILPDQYVGAAYFGGVYDPQTNQVWFRISEYIQDLILAKDGEEDYGLYLYVNSGSYSPRRWVFNGPNADNNAIRLEIVYSIINDY